MRFIRCRGVFISLQKKNFNWVGGGGGSNSNLIHLLAAFPSRICQMSPGWRVTFIKRLRIRAPNLPCRSCASTSREIQRVVPAMRSYRGAVVLVMEMGGDTHSFRSITSMDHLRALLRHQGNVVSTRTLRVPRAQERGRGWGMVGV